MTRWVLASWILVGSVGAARADEDPGERVAFGTLWSARYPPREHTGWVILRESAHRGPIDPGRLWRLWGAGPRACSLGDKAWLPSGVRQVMFTCESPEDSFWADCVYSLIEHPSGTYLLAAALPGDGWAQEVVRSLEPRDAPSELEIEPFVFPRAIAAGPLESVESIDDVPPCSSAPVEVALATPPGVSGPSVRVVFNRLRPPWGKRGRRGPKVRLLGRLVETQAPRDGALVLQIAGLDPFTKYQGVWLSLAARTVEELTLSIQILERMRLAPTADVTAADLVSLGPPPLRKGRWVRTKRLFAR